MEDHRLKAFCLIVETGSFSKAAGAKFMTQSAMSHLIRSLEDELGVKLLNRQGKAVTPTPAGRLFYGHAQQILERYKKMEDDIYVFARKVKGPLYIGASTTAATYLLPQVFYSFSRNHPEVRIELSVSNTEQIINKLHEGRIDVGIVEGNIKDARIFSEEIAEDEIVIIASDDNPLAGKKTLTAHDFLSQPFIMPETGSGIREFLDDFLHALKVDPKNIKISMTLGNQELIVQMVQSGMGISFVSKWSVFRAIKDGSVKLLHISNRKLRRKFYLVGLEKEPATMVVRTFREFISGYRFFVPF
ncbi:MAG: selenium metabolism-associated LysR family transcriptional regulator [Nitrospirae bacterium]|nr:selenium metabolism-associated LysR family transcriptional regulator [Nitrospirota bacterium]MCL5238275.1 selenium metabolism-associated LysR family transcriptional regulator [Nitrospirota bacterium]